MSSANPYALPDTLNVLEWQSWHQGILAGCLVFFSTVCVVIYLLVAGGSFQRMKEQAEAYETMGSRAFQAPLTSKPRLYDTLLEAAKTLPLRPSLGDQDALVEVCVELQVLPTLRAGAEVNSLVQTLFDISDGSARYGHGSYDCIERVWRWLPGGPYENAAAMQDALRDRQEQCRDRLDLIIKDKMSGYIVGMASIVDNRPGHLAAGIGDVFITPAFRGTYVLPETILLLLSHLFKQGYRRIEWQCDTDNTVAKKAAEKLAFFEEGVLRKHMICRDVNRDTLVMSITNSDWREGAERVVRERLRAKIKKGPTAEAITRRLLEELDQEAEGGQCADKKDK